MIASGKWRSWEQPVAEEETKGAREEGCGRRCQRRGDGLSTARRRDW
jgi:hypothetical protein